MQEPDRLIAPALDAAVFYWGFLAAIGVLTYVVLYLCRSCPCQASTSPSPLTFWLDRSFARAPAGGADRGGRLVRACCAAAASASADARSGRRAWKLRPRGVSASQARLVASTSCSGRSLGLEANDRLVARRSTARSLTSGPDGNRVARPVGGCRYTPCSPSGPARRGRRQVGARETFGVRPQRARRPTIVALGFGLLWVFDGVLQSQPSMPLGMARRDPADRRGLAGLGAARRQHLRDGLELPPGHRRRRGRLDPARHRDLAARGPARRWSRLAGLVSAAWGLVVWVFGEAFGGIFAPGLMAVRRARRGAVLLLAGVLIALPERAWATPRTRADVLRGMGAFFLGMAVLQAWPGRGSGRAGPGPAPCRDAHLHGPATCADAPAGVFSSLGVGLRRLRRGARCRSTCSSVVALAPIGAALPQRRGPSLVRVGVALASCCASPTGC